MLACRLLRRQHDLVHAPSRPHHEGQHRRKSRKIHRPRRCLQNRPLLLRLPPRPPRRRRDRSHPLRRHPQLHRAPQLHRNPPRHRRSRRLRSSLHSRQRQDQPAALLPRHHRHPLLRHLPAHRQRPARALRKRRPPLQHHRDAPHRPHRPQRSLLLRHHARPRRPHDAPRVQAPHPVILTADAQPQPTSAEPNGPNAAKRCG